MGGSWYPLEGHRRRGAKGDSGNFHPVGPGGGIAMWRPSNWESAISVSSNSSSGVDGFMGDPIQEEMENMRQWATSTQYFQMIVLETSGIKTVADLKGKTSPPAKGQTGEFAATQSCRFTDSATRTWPKSIM